MIFKDKTIILKDGRAAVLRTPRKSDADGMLNYIKTACGETPFLLRYPEEWEGKTIESEEEWIDALRQSPNSLSITCFVDGRIAGNCEIIFNSSLKTKHRASIHIAIIKEFWSLGIGSAMFEEMLAAAKERDGVDIVELEFIEGNDRAKALYEKFGFIIVGERPCAIKLNDNTFRKEFFMQKRLPSS